MLTALLAALEFATPCAAAADPSVEAELVGWSMGKPPLNALKLDVVFQNPTTTPLWFLIKDAFYVPEQKSKPVDRLRALRSHPIRDGDGDCKVIEISTIDPNLLAIKVAPESRVSVQHLPMNAWGYFEPASFQLKVGLAGELLVSGKPIAESIQSDPVCADGARGFYRRHDSIAHIEIPISELGVLGYPSWAVQAKGELSTQVTFKSKDAIFGKGWGD